LQPYTVAQLSAQFQSKLTDIQQTITRNEGIPPNVRDYLTETLRRLAQDFNASQRQLQHEWDRRSTEHTQISRDLENARQQVEDARRETAEVVADRARVVKERDDIQAKYSQYKLSHKDSFGTLDQLEQKWKGRNQELLEQIAAQEEQLKGKRALWMSTNKGKTPKTEAKMAEALRDDPFHSPTPAGTSGSSGMAVKAERSLFAAPLPPKQQFPGLQPPTGPKATRARPNLPTGPARLPAQVVRSSVDLQRSQRITTEPGDDPGAMMSSALVLRERDPYTDPSPMYQHSLRRLFQMAETWSQKYANIPNSANDRQIARSSQVLWDYMMNCTYPGDRQNAHTHVVALLDDPGSRFWFVMRMAVGYFVKDMLTIDAFYGFTPEVDNVLNIAKKSLQERGKTQFLKPFVCLLYVGLILTLGRIGHGKTPTSY